jgi:hypothetical protein
MNKIRQSQGHFWNIQKVRDLFECDIQNRGPILWFTHKILDYTYINVILIKCLWT